jgi:hypothetical protein
LSFISRKECILVPFYYPQKFVSLVALLNCMLVSNIR